MTETNWRSNPKTPCSICGDNDGSCKGTEAGLIICFKGEQNHDKAPEGYRYVKAAGDGMGGIFAPVQRQVKDESAKYVYYTADGKPYLEVKRFYSGGKKRFSQSHWDGSKWVKGLPKGFERIPYGLEGHQLEKAGTALVVEGEKDCRIANSSGLTSRLQAVATTNPEGAGKWPKGWGERYFKGKDVVIIPDNDEPGRGHAKQVWADVKPYARTVVVVLLPNLPDKGDLTDYLECGGSVNSVAEMIRNALANPEKYGIDQLALDAKPEEPAESPLTRTRMLPPLARRFEEVKDVVGGHLRLNLLTKELELDGKQLEYDDLVLELACKYYINLPDCHAKKIFVSLAKQNAYHPIVDYLNTVAAKFDSDTTVLDTIGPEYLGTDNPLHATFVRKWLISAVRRIFEPGCKVDTALILQGAQYLGKSAFFESLASKPWFDDTMGNITDKDERLKMHLVWICEWAELEQVFKRKEISTIKSFMTTKDDIIRPPYAERLQRMPRQSVICGSTNEMQIFGDVTGNRRYWIIPCTKRIDWPALAKERDRIWAAAVAAYRAGESHELTKEEFAQSEQQNAEYAFTDPWDDIIEPYVKLLPRFTTLEIMKDCLKLPVERLDRVCQNRVASSLRRLGWSQKVRRVEGQNTRVWVKDEPP